MKKTIFVATVFVTLATIGAPPSVYSQDKKTLTFDQALHQTLTNNPSIQASQYEQQVAEQQRKAAIGLRLPQISITGMYAYMSQDINIDLNDIKSPVQGLLGTLPSAILPPALLQQASNLLKQDWTLPLQNRSLGTVGGSITIPIYTGGKINAANNAAKIKVNEVRQRGYQNRYALISELTERYYGLSLALQIAEVRQQVLDGMQHHLSDAKSLETNGIIAKGERLYAEVHVAEAEREYLKSTQMVKTLNSALCNTLNSDSCYQPMTPMFILSEIEPVSYFEQLALNNNPQLKQVGLKKELAQEDVRLQRSAFAPQIALMGMGSLYNYQVTPLMPRWAVGAGITLNIFDGLNREHKFNAAKSQVKQVDAINIKAQHDILTLIDKLYNEMTNYNEQLPSIDAAYKFAQEYLRIKEEAFKEGAAPSSEVVDARLNLARIKTERLQAAYYYDMMLSKILEACGKSEMLTEYAKRPTAIPIRYQ